MTLIGSLALLAAACRAESERPAAPPASVRLATFNIEELSTAKLTALDGDGIGVDPQALAAAAIIQRVRPDVLVVQEIDHDHGTPGVGPATNARRFAAAYLAHGAAPIDYPYVYAAPSNTGRLSGLDLDRDGRVATPADEGTPAYGGDSFGWGVYPGQYAMAVLSRLPLEAQAARTFQRFLWRDLPHHHLPPGFYSAAALERLRLSSKSYWDLPVRLGDRRLHLLVSHPTPPAFDGPEDRNGRRNFDEIGFWVAYLDGDAALYDDAGGHGGLAPGELFVLAGDLNADPTAGDSFSDGRRAIDQLLSHPRVRDPGDLCVSAGALALGPTGPPRHLERATATFLGGVRVDYLLPSRDLVVTGGGVYWPAAAADPEGHRLAETASDHRLVWLDVALAPGG